MHSRLMDASTCTGDARDALQTRMVALMKRLAPAEGYTLTPLPDVRFLRADRPLASTPVLYEPGIVLVCQGRKRGFWSGRVYVYDAQHYLAVTVPVPFTMETDASADAPLLAVYLTLDLAVLASLALELDELTTVAPAKPASMVSTRMDDTMAGCVLRLLEAMSSPVDSRVLGPSIVREIYFRVLGGEQGGALRAALAAQGQFGRIAKAVRAPHPHRVRRTPDRRAPRARGRHEHSDVPFPLPGSDGHLAHAVPQVGSPASGAASDAA